MIAKTLSFGSPGKLTVKNCQLVYDGEDGVRRTFPVEDIGFVIIETGLMTISSSCIQQLADANVALVICDSSHTPSAQMLPLQRIRLLRKRFVRSSPRRMQCKGVYGGRLCGQKSAINRNC